MDDFFEKVRGNPKLSSAILFGLVGFSLIVFGDANFLSDIFKKDKPTYSNNIEQKVIVESAKTQQVDPEITQIFEKCL